MASSSPTVTTASRPAPDIGALRERTATPPTAQRPAGSWRDALTERLPVWVRVRCGIELRTLAALAVLLVGVLALAVHHFWAGRPEAVRPPRREVPEATAAAAVPAPAPVQRSASPSAAVVVVDVAGKVRDPGVRRLPAGSRVADALAAAGGAREGADISGLNRARVLVDGEQIVVGAAGSPPPAPSGSSTTAGPAGRGQGPLSLNSATLEQLDALPGVGPVLAQHILDYRTQHGGFRSVTDLRKVNGIGARRFTDLKPLVQP
ncbi:DNA-binding protein [Streptomyces mashuensis]|uniref:DNA-binding protein n=1 Tax=Streptomyces mashuensis TaxID=33904 RepID=A0A919EC17_9ACTN|nr:ComEA family DNA-binding protein [Streptomyces mashuensis]GHF35454.1 DNA-binding protein [Streptomyces mashuensis]